MAITQEQAQTGETFIIDSRFSSQRNGQEATIVASRFDTYTNAVQVRFQDGTTGILLLEELTKRKKGSVL